MGRRRPAAAELKARQPAAPPRPNQRQQQQPRPSRRQQPRDRRPSAVLRFYTGTSVRNTAIHRVFASLAALLLAGCAQAGQPAIDRSPVQIAPAQDPANSPQLSASAAPSASPRA